MDWQRELERTLANASASSSGAESSSLYDGQHFGSLLQRPGGGSGERSAWPGYRGPAHQWQAAQMASWMSQHRAGQMWQLFGEQSAGGGQETAAGGGQFRSPWEPAHDVKTIETVLNSVSGDQPQPVNYNYRGHGTAPDQTPAQLSSSYTAQSDNTDNNTGDQSPKQSQVPPGEENSQPSETEDYACEDKNINPEAKGQENDTETCRGQPEKMETNQSSPEEPKDLSLEKEAPENNVERVPRDDYDIIKNMTEKYGANINKEVEEYETRRSHLENVVSKMNKSDEEMQPFLPEEQENEEKSANVYDFEDQPSEQKPIKLKIAGGEVVANTAIDQSMLREANVETKSKGWAIEKSCIFKLKERLDSDSELKDNVQNLIGEDVMEIFGNSVDEVEASQGTLVENRNLVFLYHAVKNAINLDNLQMDEVEPLSNLALSVPTLTSLWKFLIKDSNIFEHIRKEIGKEELDVYENIAQSSAEMGHEFVQDEAVVHKMIKLYHSIRNLILKEFFKKLAALYAKTEHILDSIGCTEDYVYNESVDKLRTIVSASWSQQVIEAETLNFDFEFLTHVYSFWKKVIAKRNKPEKKPKKPVKLKPLPPMKISAPKRSSRRRNEMVTYDEDIMQDCNIKTRVEQNFLETL